LLDQSTHESVINAFRSRARGVFSRHESVAEFIDCIEHVRKGSIWAGGEETSFVLEAFKSIPAPMVNCRLLRRVRCAATGKTSKAIAREFGLSDHIVKNYLFRAFEKLGVSSCVELLFYLTIRGHSFGPLGQSQWKTNLPSGRLVRPWPRQNCIRVQNGYKSDRRACWTYARPASLRATFLRSHKNRGPPTSVSRALFRNFRPLGAWMTALEVKAPRNG
jgi:DNA-binding CsgD family transcriptional regulator